MPAPPRSRPPRIHARTRAHRFLIGFGILALAIAGVLSWEPLMGASATVDACGYVGCVPTPTMAPPPPPPPATPTATHAPPTATPQPCQCPTATAVPPTATTPPPPPPPPTATPTEQPCTCPTATHVPPTATATTPPPPPPPPTATPTNQPCTCPTATPTTAPPPPPPPATPTATMVPVDEGCTPGFWKNHPQAWNISTSTTLEAIFDVPNSLNLDNQTFLEALQGGGGPGVQGGATILLRAATAAYLNSLEANIDYPLTSAQVVSQVNAALATNNREAMLKLATTLDQYNNLGCPDAPTLV